MNRNLRLYPMVKSLKFAGVLAFGLLLLSACNKGDEDVIGSGHFEADEVMVSSEVNGRILSWQAREGQNVSEGEVLGQVDTLQLTLQRDALRSSASGVRAAQPNVQAQTAALEAKLKELRREEERTQKLYEADVATRKQLDDVRSGIDQVESQLKAMRSTLSGSNAQISAQGDATDSQLSQVEDMIRRSTIVAPISGTILTTFVQEGELAGQGRPLFSIADMKEMVLRAYVSSSEMSALKLNQNVRVLVDGGEEDMREYKGVVVWISPKSEFTPKTVQSKDERDNQVYAVKVKVPNDGFLKIGMYGEIRRSNE